MATRAHEPVRDVSTRERQSNAAIPRSRGLTKDDLAERVAALLRRNEALDDFATLVAHELKASLLTASSNPSSLGPAVELVDELLSVARSDDAQGWADVRCSLDEALSDIPERPAALQSSLPAGFPLPHALLRVTLRNLIANAVAAHARTVRIESGPTEDGWTLTVDDDGIGLGGSVERRAPGNGVGLGLCRRIAERRGGSLELEASELGGARATIAIPRAAR
jgi:signal transduction histidine kinase